MRVLYHGSDEYACQFIQVALQPEHGQSLITHADRAEETRRYLESARWDILIIDGRDDYCEAVPELVQLVRRTEALVSALVLASPRATVLDEIAALRAGADDWLVFPLPQAEFAARCNVLLRRSSRPLSVDAVRVLGVVRFDESLHELDGPSGKVKMTCTEARMLTCLLRLPGQYTSRAELLSVVWDSGPAVGREQIKVVIYRLRHKLMLAGVDSAIIEYRHGMGYRILPPDRRL